MTITRRLALWVGIIGAICFGLFDHTPHGTECHKSTSPDGLYVGERCLLEWVPGGNSEFVGRLFDASTGRLLAQHTFSTPVPQIEWLDYNGEYVSFSNGDGGDDSVYISLPPSIWDRLLALRAPMTAMPVAVLNGTHPSDAFAPCGPNHPRSCTRRLTYNRPGGSK